MELLRDRLLDLVVGVVFLLAVVGPLEWAWAARPQRHLRPELATDLGFLAFQYLVMASVFAWENDVLRSMFAVPSPPWPLWVRIPLAVIVGDLGLYWGHRLSHAVPWMWRFHSVHHSARMLDWVAAHREHPLDGLWSQLTFNVPILLLGLNLEQAMPLLVLRSAWAVFIHSNVRMPLGPLGLLLGDPVLHRFHHARDVERPANFGNLAPYLDVLFGTHHRPPDEGYALGIPGVPPRSFHHHLLRGSAR
jgi:sterol desaturase/sphingolipid hydroxylase (fatty acid hydroxylase superfamily)